MANKVSGNKMGASFQEIEAFLKEMQEFRKKAVDFSLKWRPRSGARYTTDAMILSVDELAGVLTGNPQLYHTGELAEMERQRRGWSS